MFLDERRAASVALASPWNDTTGWRLNQPALRRMEFRRPDDQVIAVEPDAQRGHGTRIGVGQLEAFALRAHAVDKEPHGVDVGQDVRRQRAGQVGHRERWNALRAFAGDSQVLAAGDQQLDLRARAQQRFGQ